MIQSFFEKNRKLLKTYYWLARIGGWLLFVFALLECSVFCFQFFSSLDDQQINQTYLFNKCMSLWPLFKYMCQGILLLGVAQLVHCFFDIEHKPSWILRNASKLFFVYIAISAVFSGWMSYHCIVTQIHSVFVLIISPIFYFVYLLFLFGMALIVGRLVPMIEESRTLA